MKIGTTMREQGARLTHWGQPERWVRREVAVEPAELAGTLNKAMLSPWAMSRIVGAGNKYQYVGRATAPRFRITRRSVYPNPFRTSLRGEILPTQRGSVIKARFRVGRGPAVVGASLWLLALVAACIINIAVSVVNAATGRASWGLALGVVGYAVGATAVVALLMLLGRFVDDRDQERVLDFFDHTLGGALRKQSDWRAGGPPPED